MINYILSACFKAVLTHTAAILVNWSTMQGAVVCIYAEKYEVYIFVRMIMWMLVL